MGEKVKIIRSKPKYGNPEEPDRATLRKFVDKKYPMKPLTKTNKEFYEKYGGNCAFCCIWSERLFPTTVKCCGKCVDKFKRRGWIKNLTPFKKEIVHLGFCYWCAKHTNVFYHLNPRVCEKCLKRISEKVNESNENEKKFKKTKKYKKKFNIFK